MAEFYQDRRAASAWCSYDAAKRRPTGIGTEFRESVTISGCSGRTERTDVLWGIRHGAPARLGPRDGLYELLGWRVVKAGLHEKTRKTYLRSPESLRGLCGESVRQSKAQVRANSRQTRRGKSKLCVLWVHMKSSKSVTICECRRRKERTYMLVWLLIGGPRGLGPTAKALAGGSCKRRWRGISNFKYGYGARIRCDPRRSSGPVPRQSTRIGERAVEYLDTPPTNASFAGTRPWTRKNEDMAWMTKGRTV
ncbi:hypothetical protein C8R43DRAFT_405439 [Mycena crocata]|nr:hypothetical protein C8R43DRAFT_405439 [Mycena crocata]